jgi:hypothetical protein
VSESPILKISDEELTSLALAADPHPVIDPHVAPWRPMADAVTGLLPDWYMPMPSGTQRGTASKVAIAPSSSALLSSTPSDSASPMAS